MSKMQLLHSPTSPFVRKVCLIAEALGLADRIERIPAAASPVQPDPRITALNPLGKVPALATGDGLVLIDSKLIVEYLASLVPGNAVLPASGRARWDALRLQAIADGVLDAAVLIRYEQALRPAEYRWDGWIAAQMRKVEAGMGALQAAFPSPPAFGLGAIATVCVLDYLDFRFDDWGWRRRFPALAVSFVPALARVECVATRPVA